MTDDRKARERATNAHFMAELKGAIATSGLTYAQVDEMIGAAEGSVGRWIRNVQIMRAPTFVAICAAVGAEPGEIMARALVRIKRDGLLDGVTVIPEGVEVEERSK